ncbi:hypothetical protein [Marinilabilia salmonicolor]|uniref:hypothetical protein n=1 Tax=Marinilabilia salmonicolor TaxID=989 RepID=UPI00029ACF10|nr:hypothetical protein [Marinilabilia salmonicolor]
MDDILINDSYYLMGGVACPFSGPADSGKPKWANFKALRNGRKFWLLRGDRFKRTRPFWFLFGAMPKRTIENRLKIKINFA